MLLYQFSRGHGDRLARLFGSHKHFYDGQRPLTGRYFKCCPCVLLSRLKFRFYGKEDSVTKLPKRFWNRRSLVKLSYMIRSVPYLMHNIINKNFDRSALLYKVIAKFRNSSSFILTESYQQILSDYEDLITSL